MMGTSLLSMPWAIEQAGLVAGLSLILVMAAICFYTAFCILQVYGIYGILLSVRVFSFNDDVLQSYIFTTRREGKSSGLSRSLHVPAGACRTMGFRSLFSTFVTWSQCGLLGSHVQFSVSYGQIRVW
jgi:hypothetical protein